MATTTDDRIVMTVDIIDLFRHLSTLIHGEHNLPKRYALQKIVDNILDQYNKEER